MDDNPLDLKTKHGTKSVITVDILGKLKAIHIRDSSKALNTAGDEHYKTKEKQGKDEESDLETPINIGKPLEEHKVQALKFLKKFSSISDG